MKHEGIISLFSFGLSFGPTHSLSGATYSCFSILSNFALGVGWITKVGLGDDAGVSGKIQRTEKTRGLSESTAGK